MTSWSHGHRLSHYMTKCHKSVTVTDHISHQEDIEGSGRIMSYSKYNIC